MNERTRKLVDCFFAENTGLEPVRDQVLEAAHVLVRRFLEGGTLLVCGNGGSCADSDHIVGELMKGFLLKRPLPPAERELFGSLFGPEGAALADKLQGALPAISLCSQQALVTAVANDGDYGLVFAQQVMGYAGPGDVVLGISTSGNARNVKWALMAAKVRGAFSMALTGEGGGVLRDAADLWIPVPDGRTFRIQELHGAVYHFLCAFAESEMFPE